MYSPSHYAFQGVHRFQSHDLGVALQSSHKWRYATDIMTHFSMLLFAFESIVKHLKRIILLNLEV